MNNKSMVILLQALCISSFANGYELMMPVRQIEKVSVGLVWFQAQKDLGIQLKSNDQVNVGNICYMSAVTNDFSVATENKGVQAKVLFQPHDALAYWMAFGSTAYEVEIPSSSYKNRLASQKPGWQFGVGMRKLFMPDTIVTPALAADIGISHSESDLTVLYPGSQPAASIQNILLTTEYRIGLAASKKFKHTEPYGGMQISRTITTIRDVRYAAEVSGKKDAVVAVTGIKLYPYPNESLICEASFIGEASFSIGWNIDF